MAQGLNYLIPLITLPFLVSHVGAQVFGVVAFGQAVAVYAQLVADYGFNISAT
ncbi:MAG TPA: flippase, partial [Cupriavidus sp.]|nr:flippase [Cupriavidus sp.]